MKRGMIGFVAAFVLLNLFVCQTAYAETKQGDPYIKKIQETLQQLGYNPGVPDGVMGAKTRQAISVFQRKVGLPVNGKDSDKLRDYLYVYSLPVIRTNDAPASSEDQCGYKFNFSGTLDIGDSPESCLPGIRKLIADDLHNIPAYSLLMSKAGWQEFDGVIF